MAETEETKETGKEKEMNYVLYHASCTDGWASAWIAHRHLGDKDTVYLPVQYGEPLPPIEDHATVYILDFSYPRDVLVNLANRSRSVTVLDHHRTAQENLIGLSGTIPGLYVHFDMGCSGAMLTWDHFSPTYESPDIIRYVQDRDLWKFELTDSREISAALSLVPFDFAAWDAITIDERFVERGRTVLAFIDQKVSTLCDKAVMTNIAGHDVPCVNSSLFQSEIGHELCKRYPDANFAAVWFDIGRDEQVWSLRSIGDFDVSVIAKIFDGGGHKNASGFKVFISYRNLS